MLLQRNLVLRIVMACNLARSTGGSSPFFRQEQLSVLQESLLRNIVNGVVAHELVNVHKYEEVSRTIMHNMIGKPVYTFTFKRKYIAITLEETSSVRIASDRTIYSVLLFQRFLVVAN